MTKAIKLKGSDINIFYEDWKNKERIFRLNKYNFEIVTGQIEDQYEGLSQIQAKKQIERDLIKFMGERTLRVQTNNPYYIDYLSTIVECCHRKSLNYYIEKNYLDKRLYNFKYGFYRHLTILDRPHKQYKELVEQDYTFELFNSRRKVERNIGIDPYSFQPIDKLRTEVMVYIIDGEKHAVKVLDLMSKYATKKELVYRADLYIQTLYPYLDLENTERYCIPNEEIRRFFRMSEFRVHELTLRDTIRIERGENINEQFEVE